MGGAKRGSGGMGKTNVVPLAASASGVRLEPAPSAQRPVSVKQSEGRRRERILPLSTRPAEQGSVGVTQGDSN